MASTGKNGVAKDVFAIHRYYMDILNAMPDVVYWVDEGCRLKGCNQHFVALLGLQSTKDFSGTPYEQMAKFSSWPKERIDSFRLDDMSVMFSGTPQYNVAELPLISANGEAIYYQATRVPLFDENKQLIGLVVILRDITEHRPILRREAEQKDEVPSLNHNKIPRILMVEDSAIAQKVERALLIALNCRVDIAESLEEALAVFKPGLFDLVLMDLGLKGTTGYLVSKKFRQMEQGTDHHVPIIAITNYEADRVKFDCNDSQMDGVLTKPLTKDQAKQLLQHYVYRENISVYGLKAVR